tara:strand:+ start:1564 stop:2022 length:459 start_codon:yes stop_codon:yes gene_type:complete
MKIKGYEDYSIYEDGRVINKHGRELKNWIGTHGYKRIGLRKDGKQKHFRLHRLLAIHFIVNTRPGIAITVDHIDRDKLNNSLSNLRWATIEEQNANRYLIPISKGGLSKNNKKYYSYQWFEDKIRQTKSFKTLELAQKFEIEHLKTYELQIK